MNEDIQRLGTSFNLLAARCLVLESALQAVLMGLAPDGTSATQWRERFRLQLDKAMREIEPNLTPQMDFHLTASVNALLEAAGETPKR